jgi:hypothetical protein
VSIFTSASQGMTEAQESPGLPGDKDSRIGIANVLALKNRRVHRVTSGSPPVPSSGPTRDAAKLICSSRVQALHGSFRAFSPSARQQRLQPVPSLPLSTAFRYFSQQFDTWC